MSTLEDSTKSLDEALERLLNAVRQLEDGDLHRAHRDGGWTVAQVISHINVCTVIWLGDLYRLAADPELTFFYREEIGHDLTGYPPPTKEIALGQLTSTRRTIATGVPALTPELLEREVEIPDLGKKTVRDWMPLILGHLEMHTGQAFDIMADREFTPAGV